MWYEWAFSGIGLLILSIFSRVLYDSWKNRVGYTIFPKVQYPIPKELMRKTGKYKDLSSISIKIIQINNYSNEIKNNIQILYKENRSKSIDIYYDEWRPNYEILSEKIIIQELYPNNSVYIHFYNISEGFKIVDVLVEGKRISSLTQFLVGLKREPKLWVLKIFIFLTVVFLIITVSVSIFLTIEKSSLNTEFRTKLEQFQLGLGEEFCGITTYHINSFQSLFKKDSEKNIDSLLKINKLNEKDTLRLNQVSSVEELKKLKQVMLCIPPNKEPK